MASELTPFDVEQAEEGLRNFQAMPAAQSQAILTALATGVASAFPGGECAQCPCDTCVSLRGVLAGVVALGDG